MKTIRLGIGACIIASTLYVATIQAAPWGHPPPGASIGDECKTGNNVPSKYLCSSGICLKAISKMYCSTTVPPKLCGWPGTGGYALGKKKKWKGEWYECKVGGFKRVSSNDSSGGGSGSSGGGGAEQKMITVPGIATIPATPMIRSLTAAEKAIVRSVFKNSINFSSIQVTNTVGFQNGNWVTKTPAGYLVNVGPSYNNLAANKNTKRLLIHEMTHVWQGQHGVPFMVNSAIHQAASVIQSGSTTGAYSYTIGKQWSKYNVEQQAEIIMGWYDAGMKTSDGRYPYIRDNVRPGNPNAVTKFK